MAAENGNYHSDGREDDRKIFVGGLSWESGEDDVREYFSQFGEIASVSVKTDPNTGRSRGFAFVTFASGDSASKVLSHGGHSISGKNVDAKRVKPQATNTKVFVGGLKPEISDEDIRQHFTSLGEVSDVEIPMDKIKNQHKGFCFITFQSEDVVRDLVQAGKTTICGVEVDVRKATPKSERGQPTGRNSYGGGGGYGGGAAAGYGGGNGYNAGYGAYSAAGYGAGYGADYSAYSAGGYGAAYSAAGGYGSAYPAAGGYGASYSGYGGDSGYNGKHAGGGRGNSRHQPY